MTERSVDKLIIVRGGGDLATGVIQKLWRAGFAVLVLEVPRPTAIRRTVALCEAVHEGHAQVEDVACELVLDDAGIEACLRRGAVPMLVDPDGAAIGRLRPKAVVDAILAKRNTGTHRGMAPVTVAMGPGFAAGTDVDVVVETMRGHDLGRLIFEGAAFPNTGIPGEIGGKSAERVVHAPASGEVEVLRNIGEVVQAGNTLLRVGGAVATAPFTGLLRGMIRPGLTVPKGMKVADIDPRCDTDVYTISDKARCIAGGVLEAVCLRLRQERVWF